MSGATGRIPAERGDLLYARRAWADDWQERGFFVSFKLGG